MENHSGADLVRQAMSVAKNREQREAAWVAASQAMHEISTLLHEHWERHGSRDGLDPITVARQHAIRELRAAAIDTTMRPPPHVAHLSVEELGVFKEELELARKRAATIVRRSLRPPPG